MKGLILKDIFTIKCYLKQYVLVLMLMGGWSVVMKSASFLSMYAVLLGGLLVLTTMSTDEMVHFDRYALTMPVSVRSLIKAKYIVLMLFIGAGILLAVLFEQIFRIAPVMGENTGWNWVSILTIATVFVVTYSITLPIIFKLGIEKARYLYIVVMLALAALIMAVVKLFGMEDLELADTGLGGMATALGILAANMSALLISYQVSLRIVKNKEW